MNIPDEVKISGAPLAAVLDWIARQPFGVVFPVAGAVAQIIKETQEQPKGVDTVDAPAGPPEPDPQP